MTLGKAATRIEPEMGAPQCGTVEPGSRSSGAAIATRAKTSERPPISKSPEPVDSGSTIVREQSRTRNYSCFSCGRAAEADWVSCPYCGQQFRPTKRGASEMAMTRRTDPPSPFSKAALLRVSSARPDGGGRAMKPAVRPRHSVARLSCREELGRKHRHPRSGPRRYARCRPFSIDV
jgi:hypothetical protein